MPRRRGTTLPGSANNEFSIRVNRLQREIAEMKDPSLSSLRKFKQKTLDGLLKVGMPLRP